MSGWPMLDVVLPALLAAASVMCGAGFEPTARRRLRMLRLRAHTYADGSERSRPTSGGAGADAPTASRLDSTTSRAVVSGLAALGVAVLVGGLPGVVIAPIVAVVGYRLLAKLEPRSVRARRARILAELPVAADLLVACLRAGRPVEASVEAVARAFSGPLGSELGAVAAALRVGADGAVAWARFADDPALAPFGRAMVRAWDTGAPIADTLDRLAEDTRRSRRALAEERARAVGVRAAAPLGLCFLPAFLLIGVAPVIIGTVRDLLLG